MVGLVRIWLFAIGSKPAFHCKYGILPEIVSSKLLVKSNGAIEMFTIIAVLIGFLIGAIVVDKFLLPV